ncbi:glycosyltransferase [Amycolatopsis taiwanensis]|uniref:glycosyltransferase n=1 Tax=Amycolatopsis taiwanensis TaxID=342230 RepID=UPI0004BB1DBC|nr:glycosyltransferase [Amycolatopsis taiwanensis]
MTSKGNRVVIVTFGTRGDVAPYTGLGVELERAGYQVAIATQRPYAELVTGCGLEYREIPGDPQAVAASSTGRRTQGTGPKALANSLRMIKNHFREVSEGMLDTMRDSAADVFVLSMAAIPAGYHIAEGLRVPSLGAVLVPVHPTGDFPAPALSRIPAPGRWGNRMVARVSAAGTSRIFQPSVDWIRQELGLPRLSAKATRLEQDARRWPVLCGYSPAVLPRPSDWREGVDVVGYWWPARPAGWEPPARLVEFLENGPPPVCITLGSMTTHDHSDLAELFGAALKKAGVRGIVQQGWADLAPTENEQLMAIGEVPYDWLFPRLAALVHHAGAGTAAAGLRAGVPAIGVPVWLDQPFWAGRLLDLGASPASIPLRRLSVDRLAAAIRAAVSDPSYRQRAQGMAQLLHAEDGAAKVVAAVKQLV